MVPRVHPRHSLLVPAVLAVVLGCGGGSGGCTGLQPLPNQARYEGPKTDNALNVRVSANGLNYLNTHWPDLLQMFAPGQQLNLPVGCMLQAVPVLGTVAIADQGGPNGGKMDGICDSLDVPANVRVTVTGFSLLPSVPSPNDSIEVTLQVEIDTDKIYMRDGCIQCGAQFSTSRSGAPNNEVKATVKFSIDQRWDRLTAFSVTQIDGAKACGASGALPQPQCLDGSDLELSAECGCSFCVCNVCSLACTAGNWDVIKNFVLQQISPTLEQKVKDAVMQQTCQACGAGLPACPQLPNASPPVFSTCTTNVCVDTVTQACVPRFLGMEGRLPMGDLLATFGVPEESNIDLSVALGSSVSVDQGLNFGTRAGMQAVTVAECVPTLPLPTMPTLPAPNFDAEATPNSGYHVGLSLSQPFLNLAMYQAHQSGTLCIDLSSSTVAVLNSDTFKIFVPSLGKVATRDGHAAPMRVVMKPARPPEVTVGQGTFDPVTKSPIKPLLTLAFREVTFDFYVMLDDRFARLFSITADIQMPLSLIFDGCSSVQPALGDLKKLITVSATAEAHSEILAEDPQVLKDLVPGVIGWFEPSIVQALKPFALPTLGAFKLKVNEAKGLANIPGTDAYNHLGLYAQLMPSNASCAVAGPGVSAQLKRSVIPTAEQMRLKGQPLPWPIAVLDVRALGVSGPAEFAYRVDGGLWSTFLVPNSAGELEVSHPSFVFQGVHQIEVRARLADEPSGISAPTVVAFRVDLQGPEVRLRVDREHQRLDVEARDSISGPDALTYAYRVGEGTFSDFGPARPISLSAIEEAGGATVRVKDEAGNVGEAIYRVAESSNLAGEPKAGTPRADGPLAGGCTSAGGPLLLGALFSLLGLLKRRRS